MLSEDIKLQLLNDHYKDSFSYVRDHLKSRDRLFVFILIVVTIMLFQVTSPSEAGEVISQLIVKQLNLGKPIDISFVGSIIWFSLLGLVVRCFQTIVHIERQYKYIHNLEEQLGFHYNGRAFTREGKSYLSEYPLFSQWTSFLYTIVFPILLLFVVFIKIHGEFSHARYGSWPLFFNIAIFLCIIISTVLYLLMVHFQK